MTKWINFKKQKPPEGMDFTYLISDGENIGIGWYECDESLNELWHEDGSSLWPDTCGWPQVTHWAEMPALPTGEE